MTEKVVEIFLRGDKVWPALLPGEPAGRPYILETLLGPGPFQLLHVLKASKRMLCHELHPQLLVVVGNNGVVQLFGFMATFPGFCFSKKEPEKEPEVQPQCDAETIAKLLRLRDIMLAAITDSPTVRAELADARPPGYQITIALGLSIEKKAEGDEEAAPKPLVKGDGSVPNEVLADKPEDAKFLKELRIKL